jgi:hypothetical protein
LRKPFPKQNPKIKYLDSECNSFIEKISIKEKKLSSVPVSRSPETFAYESKSICR